MQLSIPIAKGGASITVDTDVDLADLAMYQLVIEEGLKVILNSRMSKVGSVTKLEGKEKEDANAMAMKIANENLTNLRESKLKKKSAAGAKVAGVVMTEARRLAKEVVKSEIRAAGLKVSHVEASAITKLANELIASDPSYIETAKANIEAREAKATADKEAATAFLQKLGGVAESPKLAAAAEKAKAERKATVSAKQAGKVAPRKAKAKPEASVTA